MKDFALTVWNMPAPEFTGLMIAGCIVVWITYETVVEVRMARLLRFKHKGL